MTLSELLHIFRRRALLMVAVVVLAGGIGAAVAFVPSKSYQAQSQLLFSQPSTLASGSEALATLEKLNLLVATYAQVVSSSSFVGRAVSDAGLPSGPAATVAATNPIYASVIDITVTSTTPARAVAVADAVDQEAITSVSSTEPAAPTGSRIDVAVIQTPYGHRSSVGTLYILVISLAIGLAVAVTLALLLERP